MPDPLIGQLLLQVVLIALNAVFACAEIAVLSASEPRLEQLSKSGDKRARRLLRLTEQPSRFLSVIQVAITLSGFLGSAYAADNFSEYIVHWLVGLGVPVPVTVLDAASVFLVTLILSYITLIFGELVPKRLAMQQPEKISLAISGLVSAVSKVFAPLVWLLTRSTNGVLRLMRVDPDQDNDAVSEEEIRLMVDKGSETGAIDITERDFIENVFAFDDLTVEEFATHRTEVTFLWLEDSQEDWENTLRTTRHSRYPVCDQTSDQVVGVLSVRDYFFLTDRSRENVMQHAVQPPCFVPASPASSP